MRLLQPTNIAIVNMSTLSLGKKVMFVKHNSNWPIKCSWTPYFSQLGLFTFRFAASFFIICDFKVMLFNPGE